VDVIDKLRILSEDSRYDLACACGTADDEHRKRGSDGRWIYPVVLPEGGSTVLLKTLLSNACANDCRYCPLRSGSNVRRCTLGPEEIARAFMEYYWKRKVFGLFLSSAVIRDPDYTMDKMIAAARILRNRWAYRGYIHLKIIPGASDAAIEEALSLSTAVSLNIETPGERHCAVLSKKKIFRRDILRPLTVMAKLTEPGARYSRVKCTTQFIVGASDETDREIIHYMVGLYKRLRFKRVYFSAYQRGLGDESIPGEQKGASDPREQFIREHRLYQVDFLIRKYGFRIEDIVLDRYGNLSADKDPKEMWAERHPEFFPVRLNRASREELVRVPGIGPETASRIIDMRRVHKITDVAMIGVRGNRLKQISSYVVCE